VIVRLYITEIYMYIHLYKYLRKDTITTVSLLFTLFLVISHPVCRAQINKPQVPLLDELAGSWQNVEQLLSLPAINSTLGSAQAAHDILAIGHLSYPPVTMSGETGSLLIDNQKPEIDQARWYPYQVCRRGKAGNIKIETAVRMHARKRGLLFHIVLTNSGVSTQDFVMKINLTANTAVYKNWGWQVPRSKDTSRFSARQIDNGSGLLLRDARGELSNCFSFEQKPTSLQSRGDAGVAQWRISLRPNESRVINYVLVFGEKEQAVLSMAKNWAANFNSNFMQVKTDWQNRFNAMFTPHNTYFSGSLPLLVTADTQLRRMYYMSAMSLLSVLRTGFPVAPRVYVSNSPESNCTMMYFWDTSEWASALALLDPTMLKQYLRAWLAKGIYNGYAEEYLTGTLQGPWYSANDLSIFRLLDAYLNITGDKAFLSENIKGKTVLEHLTNIATNWKSLVRPGRTLADYGEAKNLLECVPTYIHEVASFNAVNIAMMRRAAAIQTHYGDKLKAKELYTEAEHQLPAVMALYVPGQGIWNAAHRDGTKVQIRHVFDFATIGLSIKDDLSPQVRNEMTRFAETELLTDHWMRAQSLSDIAAEVSNRPDHGPMGAYSAWPAESIRVMCLFGNFDKALNFLHRCSAITYEGPFPQSVKLMDKTPGSAIHITAGPQTYNASNGGSFMETIIRGFFGYEPDFLQKTPVTDRRPHGFSGQLINVRAGHSFLKVISDKRGLRQIPTN